MLLTSGNLGQIKYKTKRVSLKTAEVEINVALIPVSLINETKEVKKKEGDMVSMGMKILMTAIVDDAGNPVFSTIESYESLPLAVQKEITDAVWDYNGLNDDGEIEKNSVTTRDSSL